MKHVYITPMLHRRGMEPLVPLAASLNNGGDDGGNGEAEARPDNWEIW